MKLWIIFTVKSVVLTHHSLVNFSHVNTLLGGAAPLPEKIQETQMKFILNRSLVFLLPAAILFVLMVITFLDVAGRDLISHPFPGAYDIVSYLLALMVFAAAPAIALKKNHIVVDVLDGITPLWLARIRNIIIESLVLIMMGLFSWRLMAYAIDAYTYDQVSTDIYLPMWPVAVFCALMSLLTLLVHLYNVVAEIRGNTQL